MKNWKQRLLSLFLAAVLVLGCGTLPAGVRAADTAWRDGTYRGTGYGFHQGEIVLDVTVSGGEIEKVELVSQQGQQGCRRQNPGFHLYFVPPNRRERRLNSSMACSRSWGVKSGHSTFKNTYSE